MLTLKKKILLIVAVAVLLAFGFSWFLLYGVVREGLVRQTEQDLSRQTAFFASTLERGGIQSFEQELERWKGLLRGRVTLVGSDGRVLSDTESDPARMENHLSRPEVLSALRDGEGSMLRYSGTTKVHYLYFARRATANGERVVIRSAYPLESLTSAFAEMKNKFILYLLAGVLIVLLFGSGMVRLFFRPLERIVESAGRIARGEDIRFPLMNDPELQRLSSALDDMSSRTKNALEELKTEREDLARIVVALPVGVLLLDEQRKLRYINAVAEKLLGIKLDAVPGIPVERLLPSGDMYPLVLSAMRGEEQCAFFDLPELGNRYLRICSRKTATGVLLILTDLTEERRLEQARRDFIADAGHELQTPLASIRLTAEYLLGAEEEDREQQRRYLGTIIAQQERMSSLVDDMLLLSRMESEPASKDAEQVNLAHLLSAVVDEKRNLPFAARIEFASDIPDRAYTFVRRDDVVRALGNVVENGVKYVREKFGDEQGGSISVSMREEEGFWVITVA
ncbi:MAG TPA: hypothetical protein DIC53_00720, partial [Synergistaceae bacterium]|nr:hypothetical protein [Synergistaceae bacterium]